MLSKESLRTSLIIRAYRASIYKVLNLLGRSKLDRQRAAVYPPGYT